MKTVLNATALFVAAIVMSLGSVSHAADKTSITRKSLLVTEVKAHDYCDNVLDRLVLSAQEKATSICMDKGYPKAEVLGSSHTESWKGFIMQRLQCKVKVAFKCY
ncbi:MAG: hypothetical protein EOP05_02680 [Proteobacteria bacterium]|nr:MAG: hypothetical protein EOP05_02680 [Pseudomonadota bacterium]